MEKKNPGVMLPFWYSSPAPDAKGKAAVSSYSKLAKRLKTHWNESKNASIRDVFFRASCHRNARRSGCQFRAMRHCTKRGVEMHGLAAVKSLISGT
jgi:hypothetical protein